jgi:ribosomal protein S18 acetylase RimI-like enzyme
MNQASLEGTKGVAIRPLVSQDFEKVVALDRHVLHGARRGYFERRLQAALRQPKRHVQLAAVAGDRLLGFALARIAGGEFGRPDAEAILEAVGVDPSSQHHGIGRRLMGSFEELLRARAIKSLVTQVDWRNHAMMKFVDGAGFALAPYLKVERKVHRMPLPGTDEAIETPPPLVRHPATRRAPPTPRT